MSKTKLEELTDGLQSGGGKVKPALRAMGDFGDARAVAPLVRVFVNYRRDSDRIGAAEALGKYCTADSIEAGLGKSETVRLLLAAGVDKDMRDCGDKTVGYLNCSASPAFNAGEQVGVLKGEC